MQIMRAALIEVKQSNYLLSPQRTRRVIERSNFKSAGEQFYQMNNGRPGRFAAQAPFQILLMSFLLHMLAPSIPVFPIVSFATYPLNRLEILRRISNGWSRPCVISLTPGA